MADDPARRLIQFWDKPEPPGEVAALMAGWQAQFGAGYRRFDAAAAAAFLADRFPPRFAAAFARCGVPAMQADFFRYAALFALGGHYVDADTAPGEEPLADFTAACPRAMLMDRRGRVANDVMFFRTRRDPLLLRVLRMAARNIERAVSNNVWEVTGPALMTRLRADPAEAALFDGIDIRPVKEVGRAVRFVWTMDYKEGAGDWRAAHKDARSIYREPGGQA
jgi:mannosyltransferase OCH1-like enzyme